jgi:glycosyltransferase involved in cell wall biosynthesis
MPETPRVSSITAFYQKGKYLETFLEDLPRQTYFSRLEVVFDHNEPAGDEAALLKNFQKAYPRTVRYLVTNPVEPLGVSWNRCIRESSGEYLTIWNSDDLRTPSSIEKQAGYLDLHPDAGIVSGNYTVVDRFPSATGTMVNFSTYPYGKLSTGYYFGPFIMFRKSLLDRAGLFDEQFRCANDFDLAMRLLQHGRAHILPDNLGYFLDTGDGASTRKGSFCPVEATAIKLRYGICDPVDYRYIPAALKYNISNILIGSEWIPVSRFVPGYETMLAERLDRLSFRGLRENVKRRVFRFLRDLSRGRC